MENRKYVCSQILTVFSGVLVCAALMVAVFALLGYYDRNVLFGALAGTLIATVNHGALILGVMIASDKAERQDVKGGQMVITMSYTGRLAGLFLLLVLCAKSGYCNPLALVIPLVFTRPVLTIAEYINNKKGGTNS